VARRSRPSAIAGSKPPVKLVAFVAPTLTSTPDKPPRDGEL
jgi:hypothetical protein